MSQTSGAARTGLLWGVATGIIYMVLLFVRYRFFGQTTSTLGISSAIAYMVIVVMMILTAHARKKQLGGYATAKELFTPVFIVILIAELCFTVFNYIYLYFIDPGYLERFGRQTMDMMIQMKASEQKIKEFADIIQEQKKTSIGTLLLGWAQSVVIDSVVGLIIVFVMKKNPPGK